MIPDFLFQATFGLHLLNFKIEQLPDRSAPERRIQSDLLLNPKDFRLHLHKGLSLITLHDGMRAIHAQAQDLPAPQRLFIRKGRLQLLGQITGHGKNTSGVNGRFPEPIKRVLQTR